MGHVQNKALSSMIINIISTNNSSIHSSMPPSIQTATYFNQSIHPFYSLQLQIHFHHTKSVRHECGCGASQSLKAWRCLSYSSRRDVCSSCHLRISSCGTRQAITSFISSSQSPKTREPSRLLSPATTTPPLPTPPSSPRTM